MRSSKTLSDELRKASDEKEIKIVKRSGRDLGEVLDHIGWGWHQLVVIGLLAGLWIADGAQLLLSTTLVQSVADEYHLAESVLKAGLAISSFSGLCLGCVLSGILGDMWGRRPVLVGSYAILSASGLTMSVAPDLAAVYILRFFMGLGTGIGMPALVTMVLEVTPTHLRSPLAIGLNGFLPLGGAWATSGLLRYMPLLHGTSWRAVVAWAVMPACVLLLPAIFFLPESPAWLQVRGKDKQLHDLLDKIRRANKAGDVDLKVRDLSPGVNNPETAMGRLNELFNRKHITATVCSSIVALGANFMMFGQSYVLTRHLIHTPSGTFYPATRLLGCVGCELVGVLMLVLITIEVPAASGLRGLSALFSACSFCCVGMFSIDYNAVQAAVLPAAYFLRFFSAAAIALAYASVPQVFPAPVRHTGTGVCLSVGRVGGVLAPFMYETLRLQAGTDVLFLGLAGTLCCVCAFLSLALSGTHDVAYRVGMRARLRAKEAESAPLMDACVAGSRPPEIC